MLTSRCVVHGTAEKDGVTDVPCVQKKYPGDSSSETGTNLYGALKQVRRLHTHTPRGTFRDFALTYHLAA